MKRSTALPIWYRLDSADRIAEVSAEWDAVADGHGAPGARAANVVGRRIMEFLSGDPARMFVSAAVQSARVFRRPVTLPYRCDSDSERRRFEMSLHPVDDGGVRVEHQLVSVEPRPTVVATTGGWRCSQCLRVRRPGSTMWEETGAPPRFVALDVCPDCAGRLFEELGAYAGRGRSND